MTNMQKEMADAGYPFVCECGENHSSELAAIHCQMCKAILSTERYLLRSVYFNDKPVWESACVREAREELALAASKVYSPLTHNPFAGRF